MLERRSGENIAEKEAAGLSMAATQDLVAEKPPQPSEKEVSEPLGYSLGRVTKKGSWSESETVQGYATDQASAGPVLGAREDQDALGVENC